MLDWSTPWLLLVLLLLPLLRWLHRRRESSEIRVSALFLWPESAAESASQPRTRNPDPRWRLRALIAALLATAAAGPHLMSFESARIDVYIDDSPSLRTREPAGARTELAVQALVAALRAVRAGELRVFSLGRPGRRLVLNPHLPEAWSAQLRDWLEPGPRAARLPAAAQLDAGAERWLVSDGAHPAIARWASDVAIDRVIEIGEVTENVGVIWLAVRALTNRPDRLQGIVRVKNGGLNNASRTLEVPGGEEVDLTLAPGEVVQHSFEIPAAAEVRARLAPVDALREDDELVLGTGEARAIPVQLDRACGAHLRHAMRAHPGLRLDLGAEPELVIWCSEAPPAGGLPLLWFRAADRSVKVLAPLRIADSSALVTEHVTPRRTVEVRFDTESATGSRRPEYVVFLSSLLDRVTARSLLERSASVGVAEGAVRVAPGELPTEARGTTARAGPGRLDLSGHALVLAALLLLLDAWRVTRAG